MKNTCTGTPCIKCKYWDYYEEFPFYKDLCEDIGLEEMDTAEVEIISFIDFMQILVSPFKRETKDELVSRFPEYVEKIENGK